MNFSDPLDQAFYQVHQLNFGLRDLSNHRLANTRTLFQEFSLSHLSSTNTTLLCLCFSSEFIFAQHPAHTLFSWLPSHSYLQHRLVSIFGGLCTSGSCPNQTGFLTCTLLSGFVSPFDALQAIPGIRAFLLTHIFLIQSVIRSFFSLLLTASTLKSRKVQLL